MYQAGQRPELALRHIEELERYLSKDRNVNRDEIAALSDNSARLRGMLGAFDDELAQAPAGDAGLQQRVSYSLSRGCILKALEELDVQASTMSGNLQTEKLRLLLLLEAGRIDEAVDAAQRFSEAASRSRMPEWAHVVALASLTEGNYKQAIELWETDAEQISESGLYSALTNLPPKAYSAPWPLGALQSGSDMLYTIPESVATRDMEIALVALESGQLALAEETLRRALATDPETASRPLAAYYLYELTGKTDVDLLPPSEQIPILFAPEPGTPEGETAVDQATP
jgi:tetratricopeptide (TPR) repeat protein